MVTDELAGFRKYRKRENASVVAVRLQLDFDGFSYRKWGGKQRCQAGDWVVENAGDVYTVAADVFARTYEMVSPGVYRKHAEVLARQEQEAGAVLTREGSTAYLAGDYLVLNMGLESEQYAVPREMFERFYEPA